MRCFPALLAAVLAVNPALQAEEQPYAGKYAGDDEYRRIAADLPGLKERAGAVIAERFGLDRVDLSNVIVRFADMPLDVRKDVQLAGTSTKRVDGKVVQEITLNLEIHFGGQDTLERELTHEMAHAVLRNLLGEERHRAFPKWGREGLAVWAAGQGPDRVEFWLGMLADKADPAGELLNGLEGAEHTLKDYAEDFLAIAAIESGGGHRAVQRFVSLLAAGRTAREAAAGATGLTWEQFESHVREFAGQWIAARRTDEQVAAYRAAMDAFRGRRWEEARRRCFALTVRWPDTWAAALGAYYGARTLQHAGVPAEAAREYAEFRAGIGVRTGLLDDALVQQAYCFEALGLGVEAVRTIDRYVRDYPFAPGASEAALRAAGIMETMLEDGAAAAARYEDIIKAWPDKNAAAKAREKLRKK